MKSSNSLTRRQFLQSIALTSAALSAGCSAATSTQTPKPRPNIIFIFSDDHTTQSIGAYGSRLAKLNPTPNIDRIASEGVRFDRFYVGNSICAPSRATLLTGKHSHIHGKIDNHGGFDQSQQTFPKLLQKSGYQTAIFGKTHLPGSIQGFDTWETLPGQGHYYQPDFNTPNGLKKYQGYVTDIITDNSIDWLKNDRNPEKPFMLMVHHKATHRSWAPALRHLTKFNDIEIPYPDNMFDDYQNRFAAANQDMTIAKTMVDDSDLKIISKQRRPEIERKIAAGEPLKGEPHTYFRMTPEQRKAWDAAYEPKNKALADANLTGKDLVKWKYQRYMKDYLRTACAVDEGIGKILDYLDTSGLTENTIVMYCSDQGFYLGEHGWFDKRFMYEESFSTPLIARWPGRIKPGSTNKDLTQNIDLAETFLDIAGAPIPPDMQGKSLLPLLKGKTPSNWRKSLYYHYYEYPGYHDVRRHEGVSEKRFKLIRFYGKDVPNGELWEFYDIKNDPKEMNNIYGNPKWDKKIKQMKTELQRLKALYKVPTK